MIVYVIAFQHRVPGEGVGGFDWSPDRDEIETIQTERLATGFYGPEYEYALFDYQVPDTLTNDEVTEYLNADYVDALGEALRDVPRRA